MTGISLASTIQSKGKVIIASNGGKKNGSSGGAWVIANGIGTPLVEGINPDFGTIKEMDSQRSEAYGVLTVLMFLKLYCNYFMI